MFLGFYKAENCLEKHGKQRKKIEDFLGERPIMDFVYSEVRRILCENNTYDSEAAPRLVSECEGFKDISQVCKELVDDLDSLPRKYTLTFDLPKSLSEGFFEVIDENCSIGPFTLIKNKALLNEEYPISNLPESINRRFYESSSLLMIWAADNKNETRRWNEDGVSLQFNVEGYLEHYGTGETANKLFVMLKSFLGYLLSQRVIVQKKDYNASNSKAHIVAHRVYENKNAFENRFEIPEKLGKSLNDFVVYHNTISDESKKRSSIGWSKQRLHNANRIFSDPEKFQRILTACSWLFDAHANDENLLGFVQGMVSMEIILGDEVPTKDEGLGLILRNRCAYLISKSVKEREEILEEFKKIYTVRSKIVHRGKSKLNLDEIGLLNRLLWMSGRVIFEEVELSQKSQE